MGPKPRPEHAGQGVDQQGGNGSARQPRPPGSPIVHIEGPVLGPYNLRGTNSFRDQTFRRDCGGPCMRSPFAPDASQ